LKKEPLSEILLCLSIFYVDHTKSKEAWVAEYTKQGIPSSFRKEPTRVVAEFIIWLENKNQQGGLAADLGCGLGRNSFYLASKGFSVIGLDFLQENVKAVNEQARLLNLSVQALTQDVSEVWPIEPHSLDIAIDIFCYKHIVNKQAQKNYRQQLWQCLKPTGFYLISLASLNDGFYGPLLLDSPSPADKLIVDPYANIPSYLYSLTELSEEFSDLFILVEASEQASSSPMHGKEYARKVLNCIFQKRDF